MLSRCLADYFKEMLLSACRTCSAIIFPRSINHVILFFHFRCRYSRRGLNCLNDAKALIATVTLAILPLGNRLFPTGKHFLTCNRSAQREIASGKFPWIRQREQRNCPWQLVNKTPEQLNQSQDCRTQETTCCDELCKLNDMAGFRAMMWVLFTFLFVS